MNIPPGYRQPQQSDFDPSGEPLFPLERFTYYNTIHLKLEDLFIRPNGFILAKPVGGSFHYYTFWTFGANVLGTGVLCVKEEW